MRVTSKTGAEEGSGTFPRGDSDGDDMRAICRMLVGEGEGGSGMGESSTSRGEGKGRGGIDSRG